MWGESSKNCENNCQCSGLITDSFKINSGNNATKRKQEDSFATNYKLKMNPHSLDFKSPLLSPAATPKRRILGEITTNFNTSMSSFNTINSPLQRLKSAEKEKSPLIERNTQSPVTTKSFKRSTTKITRIFEERTRFKMSNKENKENASPMISETFFKLELEEETRDFTFGQSFQTSKETVTNWSTTKLDFTDALQSSKTLQNDTTKTDNDSFVPEKDMEPLDDDFETLHDLEEEFDNDNFDQCNKYEIISTDSPDIISRGRTDTSRKVTSRNFVFGAPLSESEQSTSFNKPATRSLNFDETFEFTSPASRRPNTSFSVKKSLKFNETPTKIHPLRHERSDSSIGSMSSLSSFSSPSASNLRLFKAESTTSMESGFISELEEPFLELEDKSNSPKMPNFNDLLSGQIKQNIITDRNFMRRPNLQRSLSFNPEPKAKINLFSIQEEERRSQKRESEIENGGSKRRKSNCLSPTVEEEKVQRPVLQRCFSENHASIMSALARSATEPDLIGDFSVPYALPLTAGDHSDLKSISADTLAGLIRGDYRDQISHYQIIDCRYPYEYTGGHITGAHNLYTPQLITTLLNTQLPTSSGTSSEVSPPGHGRRVLVFHCEFSIERGPKLYRYLRSSDRSKNAENYPNLNYPEIYLLQGGYISFYKQHPSLCTPLGYTAMLDPKHSVQLKKHRSQSESNSFNSHRKPNRILY